MSDDTNHADLDAILLNHRRNPRDRSMCTCGSMYDRCEVGMLVVELHHARRALVAVADLRERLAAAIEARAADVTSASGYIDAADYAYANGLTDAAHLVRNRP